MVLHSVRLPAGGTDVTEPCAFNLAGLRLNTYNVGIKIINTS